MKFSQCSSQCTVLKTFTYKNIFHLKCYKNMTFKDKFIKLNLFLFSGNVRHTACLLRLFYCTSVRLKLEVLWSCKVGQKFRGPVIARPGVTQAAYLHVKDLR